MEPQPLSRVHRQLMAELKELRDSTGLSGQRFGDLMGWSQSKVSKIENGRTKPSASDVIAWTQATKASAQLTAELISLADAVNTEAKSWGVRQGTLPARTRKIALAEAEMSHLRNFQPGVISGLLQTADYARRVITLLDVASSRDITAAINARMQRQAVLYDQDKQFDFLLTEAALRWRPGPPALMLAQLDRLLSVATLPNVTMGVLPSDKEAVALHINGFTIFDVPEDPFVHVETLTRESFYHDESEIAVYRETFERLHGAALLGGAAAGFIRHVMSGLSEA